MEEIDNELRPDVMTALIAAVTDQKEDLREVRQDPPEITLSEAEELLEKEGLANETAYLRDAGLLRTESLEEEVRLILNPDVAPEAAEIRNLKDEKHGSVQELAESDEYMVFEAPYGWPLWEGPEEAGEVERTFSYNSILGELCAVLSVYGEEILEGYDHTEYSLEAMEEEFSVDDYEINIDLERNLKILEQLGYVERHSQRMIDVYRLSDVKQVKEDAEKIADFRNDIYSGIAQNMAVAFEEADKVEMRQKGVNLVQEPETQIQ